ncbi:hypothetical protein [Crenobacter cavernae]|uniref:Uncharacterized protein n=1 Tax=Crenobacter cavernae TaxID=2290923 RepID=A0A345Y7R2_9NEIS|nr:hypothetical protein [Crenobacter cavernae]AXK39964.1 hypothetical protein DWG20_11225 [Crenobacter cavernae]
MRGDRVLGLLEAQIAVLVDRALFVVRAPFWQLERLLAELTLPWRERVTVVIGEQPSIAIAFGAGKQFRYSERAPRGWLS